MTIDIFPDISMTSSKGVDAAICTKYVGSNPGEQALKACEMFSDAMMLAPAVRTLDVHSNGMFL